jgi:hypothetical protein
LTYPENEAKQNEFLKESKNKMLGLVQIILSGNERIYKLKEPTSDNSADTLFWDHFYHWIGIDEIKSRMYFITFGLN